MFFQGIYVAYHLAYRKKGPLQKVVSRGYGQFFLTHSAHNCL